MEGDRCALGARVRIDLVGVVDRVSGCGYVNECWEYKEGDGGVRGRLLVLVVDIDDDSDPERSRWTGRTGGRQSCFGLGDPRNSSKLGEERDGVLLRCEVGLPLRIEAVRWGGATVDQKGDWFISATAGVGVWGRYPVGGRIRVGVGVTDLELDGVDGLREIDDGELDVELEILDGDRDSEEGDLGRGLRYNHSVGRCARRGISGAVARPWPR